METFFQFVESKTYSTIYVYHGTTAEYGKLIQQQGFIKPLSFFRSSGNMSSGGNWRGGLFGGNPSNPDLVYVTAYREAAIAYAKEICRKNKIKNAALVTAIPDYKSYVPDEDGVCDILLHNTPDGKNSPFANKVWQAYASVVGSNIPDAVHYWKSDENPYDTNDAALADDMKATSEKLIFIMTPEEKKKWISTHNTGAFSKPIKVVKVDFFEI